MTETRREPAISGLCSVMVPVYNGAKWLQKCLDSLARQTYTNLEIVVVDDGSTDGTAAILARFAAADRRFKIITHDRNLGEWRARNTALEAARGEYLARQDADDWCVPKRLEWQIGRLNGLPVADCVTAGTFWIGDGKNGLDLGGRQGLIPRDYLAGRPPAYPHNPTIVCRREVHDYVGPFEPIMPFGCDSVWNIRAIMKGLRWVHVPGPLYYYRRHAESMMRSGGHEAAVNEILKIRGDELRRWDYPYFIHRNLDVLSNGSCNLNCPACNQVPFRKDFAAYELSMDEMRTICRRSIEIGARYDVVGFSGGEPLLWKNLEDACKLAKESGAFQKVRLYSNIVDLPRLMNAMDAGLVDYVYSSYCNVVAKNLGPALRRHPDKFMVGGVKTHVWAPDQPIPDSLPAKCTCDRHTILAGRVYPCGAFYSQTRRLGLKIEDFPDRSCSVEDDWKAFFRGFDMYQMDLCRYCLNNELVHPHLKSCPEPHWPANLPMPGAEPIPPSPYRPRRAVRFRNGRAFA